jgi:hypothetical protein
VLQATDVSTGVGYNMNRSQTTPNEILEQNEIIRQRREDRKRNRKKEENEENTYIYTYSKHSVKM